MQTSKLKPIEIGYGDEKVIFHQRMISVAEEEEWNGKFNDLADVEEGKHEKQFQLCKDALAEFAAEMPEKLVKVKGETQRVPLLENAESAQAAIESYFAERTAENERVIRDAYFLHKRQLSPDSRFL